MLGQLDHITEEDFGALTELDKQGRLTDGHRGMRTEDLSGPTAASRVGLHLH